MNEPLSIAARKALHDPKFVSDPNCCQMFVREVLESVYGIKYDSYRADSAKHAALRWKDAGLTVVPSDNFQYQVGDILYKTNSTFGHVGIFVGRLGDATEGLVAENSTVHNGPNGCKGTRTISRFNPVAYVVRLPAPHV